MNTGIINSQDFAESCKKIKLLLFDCDGVMTDGKIILGSNGLEFKFFPSTDGMGMKMWHTAGYASGVITGRSSEALEKRASELKIEEVHQSIKCKGDVFREIIARRGLKAEEVAYIGDDLNDLSIGAFCGLFFVPANYQPLLKPYAHYILKSKGGEGVLREVVDLILAHKGVIQNLVQDFIDQKI